MSTQPLLVACYDARSRISYNTATPNTWFDLSTSGTNLTLYNTTYAADENAIVFNGTSSYAQAATYSGLTSSQQFTIIVWLKIQVENQSQSGNTATLVSLNRTSSNTSNQMRLTTTQFLDFSTSVGYNNVGGARTKSTGQWYQFVFQKNGTSGRWYLNGRFDAQVSGTSNVNAYGTSLFTVGVDERDRTLGLNPPFFNGRIRSIKIYTSGLLSDADIYYDYAAGVSITPFAPTYRSALLFGNTLTSFVTDTRTDTSGNMYVCGTVRTTSGVTYTIPGTSVSTPLHTNASTRMFGYVAKYTSNSVGQWAAIHELGSTATGFSNARIAVDSAQNVFFSAQTNSVGYVVPGGGGTYNSGVRSPFLVKYSASGTALWGKLLGVANPNEQSYVNNLASDSSGNVYVLGVTNCSGFPYPGTAAVKGANLDRDTFVAKFSSASGTGLWSAYTYMTASGAFRELTGLSVNPRGDVTITGSTSASGLLFNCVGTSGFQIGKLANGVTEGILFTLSASGTLLRSALYNASGGSVSATAAAYDTSGNLYVAGGTTTSGFTVSGTPFTLGYGPKRGASRDAFLVKYTPSGTIAWSTLLTGGADGTRTTTEQALAVDETNGVYFAGTTNGRGYNPHFILSSPSTGAGQSAFFLKYTADGAPLWGSWINGASGQGIAALAVQSGTLYAAGITTQSGLALTNPNFATGGVGTVQDGYLLSFSSSSAQQDIGLQTMYSLSGAVAYGAAASAAGKTVQQQLQELRSIQTSMSGSIDAAQASVLEDQYIRTLRATAGGTSIIPYTPSDVAGFVSTLPNTVPNGIAAMCPMDVVLPAYAIDGTATMTVAGFGTNAARLTHIELPANNTLTLSNVGATASSVLRYGGGSTVTIDGVQYGVGASVTIAGTAYTILAIGSLTLSSLPFALTSFASLLGKTLIVRCTFPAVPGADAALLHMNDRAGAGTNGLLLLPGAAICTVGGVATQVATVPASFLADGTQYTALVYFGGDRTTVQYAVNGVLQSRTTLPATALSAFTECVFGRNAASALLSAASTAAPIAWAVQSPTFNTAADDTTPSIATDRDGNLYIAYATTGTVSGGGGALGGSDIVLVKLDPYGMTLWTRQASLNTAAADTAPAIATDSLGNVYLAYASAGTASGAVSVGGTTDCVVMKLDSTGAVQWVRQTGTAAADTAPVLGVDATANVYVAYVTAGTASGGTLLGSTDIVLCKLTTTGTIAWIRQTTAMNTTGTEASPTLAITAGGTAYLCYTTTASLSGGSFGGGTRDTVLLKLDTNGTQQWMLQGALQTLAASTEDTPNIATDASEAVYVTYTTAGTISGGAAAGNTDTVVYKISAAGTIQWSAQRPAANTSLADTTPWITLDAYGGVYIAYMTNGTASGGVFSGTVQDIVLYRLNSATGALQWVRQTAAMNTTGDEITPEIVTDADGNVFLVYTTNSTVSGGTNMGASRDIVALKFSNQRYTNMVLQSVVTYDGDLTSDRMAAQLLQTISGAQNTYASDTGIYAFGASAGFRSMGTFLYGAPTYTSSGVTLDGVIETAALQTLTPATQRTNTALIRAHGTVYLSV